MKSIKNFFGLRRRGGSISEKTRTKSGLPTCYVDATTNDEPQKETRTSSEEESDEEGIPTRPPVKQNPKLEQVESLFEYTDTSIPSTENPKLEQSNQQSDSVENVEQSSSGDEAVDSTLEKVDNSSQPLEFNHEQKVEQIDSKSEIESPHNKHQDVQENSTHHEKIVNSSLTVDSSVVDSSKEQDSINKNNDSMNSNLIVDSSKEHNIQDKSNDSLNPIVDSPEQEDSTKNNEAMNVKPIVDSPQPVNSTSTVNLSEQHKIIDPVDQTDSTTSTISQQPTEHPDDKVTYIDKPKESKQKIVSNENAPTAPPPPVLFTPPSTQVKQQQPSDLLSMIRQFDKSALRSKDIQPKPQLERTQTGSTLVESLRDQLMLRRTYMREDTSSDSDGTDSEDTQTSDADDW